MRQFGKVLVVIAHPDDESMAGGTIAKFASLPGKSVRIIVLTNGDKGSGDLTMTSPKLAALRAVEMHAAAAALGADAVLLEIPDGELENTYTVRMRVAAQIRLFEPDLLVTFNPNLDLTGYRNGRAHRDHNIAGV
jgi:LmbE family N-acetylglucosaminyl deacetylase